MTLTLATLPDLLQSVLDTLTTAEGDCALNPQPCRVALYPGGEVAWDVCETGPAGTEGQLWANLQPMAVTDLGANCFRVMFTAQVGITRCEHGSRDDGTPPAPEAVASDARQQALDADTILRALQCCFDPTTFERPGLVSWEPLGPSGGCYGGAWTIRGVVDVCC